MQDTRLVFIESFTTFAPHSNSKIPSQGEYPVAKPYWQTRIHRKETMACRQWDQLFNCPSANTEVPYKGKTILFMSDEGSTKPLFSTAVNTDLPLPRA